MDSAPGVLFVTVESASDLHLRHRHRRHDVYCVVRVGSQTASTQVAIDAGSSPVWNQAFPYQLSNETSLEIEVKDAHARRHRHAGSASLPLAAIRTAGSISDRLQLPLHIQRRRGSQQTGVISLLLTYWPPGSEPHEPAPGAVPDAAAAAADAKLGAASPPQPPHTPSAAPAATVMGIPVGPAPAGYYPTVPVPGAAPQLPYAPQRPEHDTANTSTSAYGRSGVCGGGVFPVGPIGLARSTLRGANGLMRCTRDAVVRTAAQASGAVSSVVGSQPGGQGSVRK